MKCAWKTTRREKSQIKEKNPRTGLWDDVNLSTFLWRSNKYSWIDPNSAWKNEVNFPFKQPVSKTTVKVCCLAEQQGLDGLMVVSFEEMGVFFWDKISLRALNQLPMTTNLKTYTSYISIHFMNYMYNLYFGLDSSPPTIPPIPFLIFNQKNKTQNQNRPPPGGAHMDLPEVGRLIGDDLLVSDHRDIPQLPGSVRSPKNCSLLLWNRKTKAGFISRFSAKC